MQDASSLVASREPQSSRARDLSPGNGAMDLRRLEQLLDDIRNQPGWRAEADKAVDYYDGNQLDAETISKLRERGLGELSQNLIKPTVDAVLGLEAKTRTDWMVTSEDDRYKDVVDAYNTKLKEAEQETRADRACSDAHAGQIKAGFHVVEVSRTTNPFDYPYRCLPVHRREIYWDWHSLHPTWDDARYLVRKRWHDADVAAAFFPQHAELIQWCSRSWAGDWAERITMDEQRFQLLSSGQDVENRTKIDDLEWRDSERGRVCIFEVWYRTYHRGAILWLPDGRKVEFDQKNAAHVALVASGTIQPRVGVYDKLRLAYFIGPHRVYDAPTTRRRFPYIPFWGYREDLTGAPYGLIRSMLSPQDEVNARRAKMMWLLSAKRIVIDADALDDRYNSLSHASRELARADAFIVTNQNRVNKDGIRVDENMELAEQQFKLLMEAKSAVQEAGGIYAAMMGQNSNATSGAAIQSLIEQGTMTLAEINDNYFFARRQVGESLMELIKEDMKDVMNQQLMVDSGIAKRQVTVNIPKQDPETGMQYLENDTSRAPVRCSLTDVPSTPSFRAQQFTQLAEIAKSLPPQLQAFVVPFIIEASELSKRGELSAILRKQLGIEMDPNSPEGQQAMAKMAEEQAKMQNLQMQEAMAKINQMNAAAEKSLADAEKVRAEIGQGDPAATQAINAEANKLQQEVMKLQAEVVQLKADQSGKLAEAQMKSEAEVEKAMAQAKGQEVVAQIEQEAQIEIARINAEAEAKIAELTARMDEMQRNFEERLQAVRQESADRDAKGREESAKKEADEAKKEAQEAKAEKEKPEDKPREPMVVVVPGGGGKRKRTIKFKSDDKGALIGADVEDDED